MEAVEETLRRSDAQEAQMQPHERLKAWELAHKLYLMVHEATRTWPRAERYELTSQVLRAAFSVPANIVEGASRKGPREFRKALDIARGSLAELGRPPRVAGRS